MGNAKTIDLFSSYLCLKTIYNSSQLRYNEKFCLISLKFPNTTFDFSRYGKIKICSIEEEETLEQICQDLWQNIFKKNLKNEHINL